MNEATIFHILHSLSVTNKRMLRLRRKSVEKRNSRGDIVRKEEVVTLTKKFHASNKAQEKIPDWKPTTTGRPYEFLPPYQGVLLSNLPRQFPPQGRQLEYINEQDLGGFSKTNAKNFEAKVSNAEDSDAEDVEGSDAEDTNSEECEVDDTNSEKSEDDDTNSEESQDENSNYEESETEEINSEESEAEDINSEESEAEDINSEEYETEDINSEESEAEDINSEESSEEYEDSDNEPPRHLMDLKPAERRNLSTGRHHFTIDRMSNRSMMGRNFWFQE
ncbi:dentin matrix acidic phosphoprotein 1-like isoform X10 [Vigna unguiculata]|uniref:dentin matrix acidic phosphoprotein 1-like isoform X10 n=1 Tax=Vigna unguiculata TaxID=3917 RepID=UPI0010164710|nr:dentin matrix acidic phosphoprotein 1-like isoform X10 [Vigna unguiculata]